MKDKNTDLTLLHQEALNIAARMMILRNKYKEDAKEKSLVCNIEFNDGIVYKCVLNPDNIFGISNQNNECLIACNLMDKDNLIFIEDKSNIDKTLAKFATIITSFLGIMLYNEYKITQDLDNTYYINFKVGLET